MFATILFFSLKLNTFLHECIIKEKQNTLFYPLTQTLITTWRRILHGYIRIIRTFANFWEPYSSRPTTDGAFSRRLQFFRDQRSRQVLHNDDLKRPPLVFPQSVNPRTATRKRCLQTLACFVRLSFYISSRSS